MKHWTGKRWTRDQLIFMVETVLVGVIDRLCLPSEETDMAGERDSLDLSSYEKGALEAAGMTLAVMCAKITDDGLGIYDALTVAGRFDEACENLIATSWADGGHKICDRMVELQNREQPYGELTDLWEVVYPGLYPDAHKHAVAFVDRCFGDYYEN